MAAKTTKSSAKGAKSSASSAPASGLTLKDLAKSLAIRNVGPSRGGRVIAVAGDPNDQATFYFGAVCGGVFKTNDAGLTWINITDGFLKTSSVGSIVVAPSDPNVIYIGMGESTIRTDVSYGDGVYKSTDGGKTWAHCGLTDTRHIGKIDVHPKNPDIVYVAALGHAFGDNEERGFYKSTDGGKTWRKTLYKSTKAGAVDFTFDPRNPDIIYTSVWQVYRNGYELVSGGPDSGLWRSNDGGETWTEITKNKGLPSANKSDNLIGKIGLSASPVQAGRVYAIVESKEKPGLYRSDDFGNSWALVSDNPDLRRRPFYYMHVHCDTQEPDTVYINNMNFSKSTDAGKTFTAIPTPHGDNHGLWIDPKNNKRMIQSNDGGANVSFNGGFSFSSIHNQLTGQYYQIDVDNQFPYRLYATQQDNSSISVPNDTISGPVTWGDCNAAGTGESGYIAIKPDDPNIVVVGAVGSSPGGMGALQKYDHRTRQIQLINVWPAPYSGDDPSNFKHRVPWTSPIFFSPHDSDTLYVCAESVFRSTNLGQSWDQISPDLTTNDRSKQKASGGPITLDTSGAEFYCTIFTLRESPHTKGVLMSGSDDGLIYITHDDGKNWVNVTEGARAAGLPEWAWIRTVEPSPHAAGTWYMAATKYKLDDTKPYVFKSTDDGKTWSQITNGIAEGDYVRVVRSDPNVAGVLYCGTETGLYVSVDDGANWTRWESLPVTPVFDLKVKDHDLVIATHGRGFWIVDDLTPIYDAAKALPSNATLFNVEKIYRIIPDLVAAWAASEGKGYSLGLGSSATFMAGKDETGQVVRTFLDAGQGAPRGVALMYYIPESQAASTASLKIYDSEGKLLRSYAPKVADYDKWDDKKKNMDSGPWITVKPGMNKFVWNLRLAGAERVPGNKTALEMWEGPLVLPGQYKAVLELGETKCEIGFEVVNDPRVKTSMTSLRQQLRLLTQIRDSISDCHRTVNKLRDVRDQVKSWEKHLTDADLVKQATDLVKKLDAVEDKLITTDADGLMSKARLNAALGMQVSVVSSADSAPTKQSIELYKETAAKVDAALEDFAAIVKTDIKAFNSAVRNARVNAVVV